MPDNSEKKTLKKRKALGKGLGAILGESNKTETSTPTAQKEVESQPTNITVVEKLDEISIDYVERNPFQPRLEFQDEALKELADSIRVQGIIQPITVRKLTDQQYQIISGERRWRASKMAGLEKIPAYIKGANDTQMLEMALIENIQREDLNPIEVAISYQRLIAECELKQEELGDRVGKKRSTVANYLRLLKLPPEIQSGLRKGVISMGHARALVNVNSIEVQLALYDTVVKSELSVRKTENLVRDIIQGKDPLSAKAKSKKEPLDFEFSRLQRDLSTHFGTQIKIKNADDGKGEIKIPYQSIEDLNRILDILKTH
ncbi:ParB/RepB/Spo0J family partition protein [Flammeovirga sp. EKP202]|uniref:ParB/RepB/Spo0J family partition protein n=1 Tax=Flammeovirga sp. EKP202 TaxID=2770592 RepID=UPI00165F5E8E|nr:ParB/RepB/Spo0J family partition protein [Flammeovirga sp. EKP202]MBD0403581.1 ParB/RepB/Spo0J family partition protein [Flammeovirga sp. EKP202]